MPNRIIREAILSSEKVALLGWPEEVFYRRLMSIVDDYGRTEANPQLLRSKCYPLQTDLVRVADITRWMAACQMAGLILHYELGSKQYLEVSNFGQQQRTPSKWPPPLAIDSKVPQEIADAHLGVVVVGDVEEISKLPLAPAPLPEPLPQLALVAKPWEVPDCPHAEVLTLWAEVLPAMPQHLPSQWKGGRADHLRARWRESATADKWPDKAAGLTYLRRLFGYVGKSLFLTGRSRPSGPDKRPFVIELEWLVNPTNWAKVIEGKYHQDAA